MIKVSQENLVVVENGKGKLVVEQETQNCICMQLKVTDLALTMVGLYDKREIVSLLSNMEYYRMENKAQVISFGQKKIVETIFARTVDKGEISYTITFLSEDTTYTYELSQEDWQEIMSLLSFISEQD